MLHICCGPCAIYPVRILREDTTEVTGFFYRHNIHPYTECLKRQETLESYAAQIDLKVICQNDYKLEEFLRNVTHREVNRCAYCYHDRLQSTALIAKRSRSDGFSTTLLYSKFQNHQLIRSIGEAVGESIGIPFYYYDFRVGWKDGVDESKRMKMYRQSYCGCVYSEKERFYKPPVRRSKK